MKKVLALVVAFALCFTAIAGCFAVSATAPDISIEIADTSFEISGANYTVKIAQITELTVQNGLAVVDIYNGETKLVEYKPEMDDEDDPVFDWVRSTDKDGNTVIKFLNVINAGESFAYTVNVDVEKAEPGDYAITATVEAGDYEAGELVDVESASATFTVEAPHVCDFVGDYLSDENGHWKACACGATSAVEAHVEGEAVEENGFNVVYCSVCNYKISETPVEPEHTCDFSGEGVVTTPAKINAEGVMTYTCKCGETKTEAIPRLKAINWNPVTYNITNDQFAFSFTVTSEFSTFLGDAKANGATRRIDLYICFGDKVYEYQDVKIKGGVNTASLTGIATKYVDTEARVYYAVYSTNPEYNLDATNAAEANCYDLVAAMGTTAAEKYLAYMDAYNAAVEASTDTKVACTLDGFTDFVVSSAYVDVVTGTVSFTHIPQTSLTTALGANGAGGSKDQDRKITLKVQIGTSTFTWEDVSIKGGSNSIALSALSLSRCAKDVKVWYEITNSRTGYSYTTDTITMNVANTIADSDLAVNVAYTEFLAALS